MKKENIKLSLSISVSWAVIMRNMRMRLIPLLPPEAGRESLCEDEHHHRLVTLPACLFVFVFVFFGENKKKSSKG